MADATTASSLLRHLRARMARAAPDFGDHGTAFGLELSMSPTVTPPAAGIAPSRDAHWWQFLSSRRVPHRP